ncbi:MAG: DUF11 domain-containing protein [Acidobacteria bacterium]|nr:DUF11 domain-containing protein [Acidobacteriota bacterium]MBV9475131.1 DUF11 domain-containing protein [Acidobacteriota bacterium]
MTKLRPVLLLLCLAFPTFLFAQSADQEVVSVVDAPDPVAPGGTVTYTVTLRNNGPDAATNGGINGSLPLQLSNFTYAPPAGFSCGAFGNSISCTTPSFAAGTTVVIGVTGTVDASMANFPDTSFSATFSPSGTTPDPNNSNNSKSATTNVDSPQVDVGISVTDSPDPVMQNNNVTYTATVTNSGPDAATNVNFNVFNSSGLKFVSGTQPAGWTCAFPPAGGTPSFSCSRASFPGGATSQFDVVLNFDRNVLGPFDGTYTVAFGAGGTGNDTNPGNNNENETTQYVTPDSDMAITSATDSPDPVTPDGDITYTVTVANNGPDPATNAAFSVPMNNTLKFRSVTTPAGWTCNAPPVGTGPGFDCHNPSFAVGSSVFTVVLRADSNAFGPFDQTINQGFVASSDNTDPNNGNNTTTVSTQYTTADSDMGVSASDSPDPVMRNGDITYTVTVTNGGPDAATNAALSVPMNNTLKFQSITVPSGWNCPATPVGSGAGFTCTNPSFANGANSVFTIVLRADENAFGNFDQTITQNFNVGSNNSDPNNANNSVNVTTQMDVADADLSVTATDAPDPVLPGSNITYTGSVANGGPDAATTVSLNIPLSPNVTFVSMTGPAGFSCTTPAVGANGNIVCTNASLANGANLPFTLVTQVNAALEHGPDGVIQQGFTISSADTHDPDVPDNSLTVNTAYDATQSDLGITTTGSPNPANNGDTVTYTSTLTNAGPDAASNVVYTLTLPANTGFGSVTPPAGFLCTTPAVGASGVITCTATTFPNGGTGTFIITATVTGTSGTITAPATITTDTYDPNASNNTTSTNTTIAAPTSADLSVTKTTNASTVAAGSQVTYTIGVHNAGPDAASNVVMTDVLPASLHFVSITQPSGFSCTTPAVGASGTITCTAATLASGVTRTFTLTVAVAADATGSIANSASVASDTSDPTGGNDSVAAPVVPVVPAAATTAVPTLSQWALLMLAALLAVVALRRGL